MKIENAGNLLLPVIAYGDAAGLPFETWPAQRITDEVGYVESLYPPIKNSYFADENAAGIWSDDTQLSVAVARALIEAQGFDINAIARHHVVVYDETPQVQKPKGYGLTARGWGGSTVNSIKRIKSGVAPLDAGELAGNGNGIIMKMGPLVLWQVARGVDIEQRRNQYDQLTQMTHNTAVAKVCTRVHGDVLTALLEEPVSYTDLGSFAVARALSYEEELGETEHELSNSLDYTSGRPTITHEDILDFTDGKGFYAPQTLAMVYGAYLAHQPDFQNTIYGAVNLGGDTDSTASISGTMALFANPDTLALPADIDKVKDIETLRELSEQFTKAALKGGG